MGQKAPLVVELDAVLHEPALLLVGAEHPVLHVLEEVRRKALLEGQGPLGRVDEEVVPVGLAFPHVAIHLDQALPELCSGPALLRVGHCAEQCLPLLRSDTLELGKDPAVELKAAGVAELPGALSHAVSPRTHKDVGELLGDLGAAPVVWEACSNLEVLLAR